MSEIMSASVALQLLLGIIGYFCIRLFNQVSLDLRRLADSVERLNISMAGMTAKTESLESRVTRLEEKEA